MVVIPEIQDFQKLVSKSIGENWKYVQHSSKYLTAPGENYGSIILSIDVLYENNDANKTLNLVAKLCPPTDLLKEAFLTSITFKKEADTYLDAIPAIERLQTEFVIKNRLNCFAKCFGARMNLKHTNQVDNDAVIILENLKIQGYASEDRMLGADLKTARLILQNLARFHASVIALREVHQNEFDEKILPCCKTVNNGGVMIDGFIGSAIEIIKDIPELVEYSEKFIEFLNESKQIGGMLFPKSTNPNFYSLIHTDFWTNNMMIKKLNNQPISVKIVDLQLTDYGSIIRDLLFFLYSSVQIEIFNASFDELIRIYYRSFIDTLMDFRIDLKDFTWRLFAKELNEVAPHELFHIIFMLKPIFSEKGSIESIESLDVDAFKRTDNLGVLYREKLKQVVLSYVEKKWL